MCEAEAETAGQDAGHVLNCQLEELHDRLVRACRIRDEVRQREQDGAEATGRCRRAKRKR